MISSLFFGLSIVYYNVYLKHLVFYHWTRIKAIRQGKRKKKIRKIENILADDISQY